MAAAGAAFVILAGCGSWTSDADSAGSTTTTKFSYGAEPSTDASTTTVAGRPATGATGAATTAGAGAGPAPAAGGRAGTTSAGPKVLNQSRRDDAGLQLVLTVGGDLDYAADEGIVLEMSVLNTSKTTKYYDPNARPIFGIGPERGGEPNWQDDDCRSGQGAGDEIQGGAIDLPPNDDALFQANYPGPASRRVPCRLPAGTYVVFGSFPLCPAGPSSSGACDPARVTRVQSAPVRITIR